MLHKETQCRECELLSQHHEATKPKIKFPSKIKKKNKKKKTEALVLIQI